MATILYPDNTTKEVSPANGKDFSLAELKESIGGGYIELCRVDQGHYLVIDEEGKLKGMSYNHTASVIYGSQSDVIVGPALYCKMSEVK